MNVHIARSVAASEESSACSSRQPHLVSSDHLGHQTASFATHTCSTLHGMGRVDNSTNRPPRDFSEFYSRFPRFVRNLVRRKMINRTREDQQDRESELLEFLMTLPETSKFRTPGTNGHETGCRDRIMTFNPERCGGASPGQFLSYISRILLNKFITLERKHQSNPACRRDTLGLSGEGDEYHSRSSSLVLPIDHVSIQKNVNRFGQDGAVWFHVVVQEFFTFIRRYNPELLPLLGSLSTCLKLSEAQNGSGLNKRAFYRGRSRLLTLYRCFQLGSPPPKQRRYYRDRVLRRVLDQTASTDHPSL